MDEITINLTVNISLPQDHLPVNGVLFGLSQVIKEVFFILLKVLLEAMEERERKRLSMVHPGRYVKNGHQTQEKVIRTEWGIIRYHPQELKDQETGRTFILLRECGFFSSPGPLSPGDEKGVGLSVHLSYRLAAKEISRLCGFSPSAMTIHRRVKKMGERWLLCPTQPSRPYRFLMADGTGFRRQGSQGQPLRNGELRLLLASPGVNHPFEPIGVWVNTSWEKIKAELSTLIDTTHLEVLFADGEPGIDALLFPGMRFQRCLVHGMRDLAFILYADGLKKKEQQPFTQHFDSFPVFSFPQKKLEILTEEDTPRVREAIEKTKQGFLDLLHVLNPDTYPRSRAYIKGLSGHLFTFFDWWLEKGEVIHQTTNPIEGAFSRIKNRIWSIGRRWSDQGLLHYLRVALLKIFSPETWKEFWEDFY
ncbi:MAG: hypothetical protein NTX88_02230, partial [Candidatus Atribacteria bacterium]|nr:hypothetical protein [Candidatus Atribacteria bacterium]